MTPPDVMYCDIWEAIAEVNERKGSYLKRWGWEATCATPGAYWLWRRDFAQEDAERLKWWQEACDRAKAKGRMPPSKPTPYGVITAPTDLAVEMTIRDLDDQPELQNDDDE